MANARESSTNAKAEPRPPAEASARPGTNDRKNAADFKFPGPERTNPAPHRRGRRHDLRPPAGSVTEDLRNVAEELWSPEHDRTEAPLTPLRPTPDLRPPPRPQARSAYRRPPQKPSRARANRSAPDAADVRAAGRHSREALKGGAVNLLQVHGRAARSGVRTPAGAEWVITEVQLAGARCAH